MISRVLELTLLIGLGSRASRLDADQAAGDVIEKKLKSDNYNQALENARVQTKQSRYVTLGFD